MKKTTTKKHLLDYHDELIKSLQDPIELTVYLKMAFEEYQEENDSNALLLALRNAAEAKGGITKLAKKTHLSRQHLYTILAEDGNPRLNTFTQILKGLDFNLSIVPN